MEYITDMSKNKKEWHRWFAWHPVVLKKFPILKVEHRAFLECVERRWTREGYEYRAVQKGTKPPSSA